MSIRIEKCPYCGKTLKVGRGSKQGAIDSPFRICYCCTKEYVENGCYEFATADIIQKLISLNAFGNNLCISALLALFLAFASDHYFVFFIVFTIVADAIITGINFLKKLDDISASMKRCENPYYVLKLGSVGRANVNSDIYKESLRKVRELSNDHMDYLHTLALKKDAEKKQKYRIIIGCVMFFILLAIIGRLAN